MAIQALFRMGRGARFDIDEFDSPNGSYLASRPHDRVVFSPLLSIAGRLSADCFVRNPCGRPCRQTAFETCPHRHRPLHCRGGRRLDDCLVGRQLTCMANSHRPVSPCSWHFVLHASLPISHAPSRPARASRSPIGVTQAIQSGGYILGAALAAVIYPVAGITAMIVLDVLGALFASLAVLAAQIDAGGLDEADRSLPFSNKVRELFSEISDGYKLTRGYRGLLALLWCGFVFAFAFSPLAALFPIMTLGHFGGSTGDAALAEILFSAGMLAGSGILAVTGGFRNRSFTMVAAIAGFGIAAIVSGSLGPSLFAAFLPVSFLMGACSPLYAGTQTALMQEQIPPEYLGRVFGLYGTIMAWAMPMGLAAPSVFADLLGAPLWFVGSGATMVLLAMAMLLAPSVRNVGKRDTGRIQ